VERDGIEIRKYSRKKRGKFRICKTYEIGHGEIGSSVRPREEWERMKAE
jgi:hypothetical protein